MCLLVLALKVLISLAELSVATQSGDFEKLFSFLIQLRTLAKPDSHKKTILRISKSQNLGRGDALEENSPLLKFENARSMSQVQIG